MSEANQAETETGRIAEVDGQQFRLLGRAWWLDSTAETRGGKIAVARIHAESLTRRLPSQEELGADPTLNPYRDSEHFHGRMLRYMLSLSEQDLERLGLTPGILNCRPGDWILDGPRPRTNITSQPVALRRQQQHYDWLQNDCIGRPRDY